MVLDKCLVLNFSKTLIILISQKALQNFWRRWHISLGTWFREYVYIPLGGNRKGLIRQIFNLLIVWFCTGFWHGASWNFLIWGGYYGVLLIIEKLFLLKVLKKIPAFFSHVYTLFFVVIGWVIFGFDDMTKGWEYLKGMFGFGGLQLVGQYVIVFVAIQSCTNFNFDCCKHTFACKIRKKNYVYGTNQKHGLL